MHRQTNKKTAKTKNQTEQKPYQMNGTESLGQESSNLEVAEAPDRFQRNFCSKLLLGANNPRLPRALTTVEVAPSMSVSGSTLPGHYLEQGLQDLMVMDHPTQASPLGFYQANHLRPAVPNMALDPTEWLP